MTALTADRATAYRDGDLVSYGVAASAKIFAGALVCVDANGYATPGAVSATLKAVGRAEEQIDNSAGANGDLSVTVRKGVFKWANAGDVTIAHLEATVYIDDDQTVSSVSTGKSAAGTCKAVDSDGVWVEMR